MKLHVNGLPQEQAADLFVFASKVFHNHVSRDRRARLARCGMSVHLKAWVDERGLKIAYAIKHKGANMKTTRSPERLVQYIDAVTALEGK